MGKFFHPDNPLMRFLSRFFDLMCVNIAFIFTCIPIFTIGSAISAMYGVTIKLVQGDEPYLFKAYFRAFKSNFKQATLLWLPILAAFIFFGADLYVVYFKIDASYKLLQVPIWFFLFVLMSLTFYSFPLIGTFENTTGQIVKNALLLSLSNLPTTIFFMVIHFVLFWVATRSGRDLVIVGSILLFFGFAAIAFFCSIFLNRIFEKCIENEDIPQKGISKEENEKDDAV